MADSRHTEQVRPAASNPATPLVSSRPPAALGETSSRPGARTCCGWDTNRFICLRSSIANCILAARCERRVRELHEMFRRPEVKAVVCARGGYGCNYLLPHLDLALIRANPKIFVGCSDVTTFLTYFCDAAGLVTFHGPMVAGDFARPDGVDERSWQAAVSSPEAYSREFRSDEVQVLSAGTRRREFCTAAVFRCCAHRSAHRTRFGRQGRSCSSKTAPSGPTESTVC